jgi:hypothetical protein
MAKKKPAFQFPDKLLDQINECSNGGFILFTFDDEGMPQPYAQFDNPIAVLALRQYIADWSAAVQEVSVQHAIDSANPRKKR